MPALIAFANGQQLQLFDLFRAGGIRARSVGLVEVVDFNPVSASDSAFDVGKLQQLYDKPLDTKSGTVKLSRKFILS